jgi:ABC-type multidrug transport system fused ATPase/permease subunit
MILENGKITEGTHDTLVRSNQYYRKVCELQNIEDMPPFEGGED